MVLTEATASDGDFYTDSSNPPDTDTSSSPNSEHTIIDLSTLPSGMPIFGPMFGFTQLRLAALISVAIASAAARLDRPPTRDEIDAIAYHTAHASSIASYGPPLGFAAGLSRAYKTRSTWRFPFFEPNKETFTPDKFGPLKGQAARRVWHFSRGCGYGVFGMLVGGAILGSYAASVGVVGELRDNRLKPLMEAVKDEATDRRMGRNGGRDITGQGPISAGELWKNHRKHLEEGSSDMSPTGGEGMDTGSAMDGDSAIDATTQTEETRPQKPTAWSRAAAAAANRKPAESRGSEDFYGGQDDASPTAGNMDDASSANNAEGESAWARLRREAGSNTAGTSRAGVRKQKLSSPSSREEQTTGGDSFSFSATDQDKHLARDEAQREFDERLEKERRGGDFSSGMPERRW